MVCYWWHWTDLRATPISPLQKINSISCTTCNSKSLTKSPVKVPSIMSPLTQHVDPHSFIWPQAVGSIVITAGSCEEISLCRQTEADLSAFSERGKHRCYWSWMANNSKSPRQSDWWRWNPIPWLLLIDWEQRGKGRIGETVSVEMWWDTHWSVQLRDLKIVSLLLHSLTQTHRRTKFDIHLERKKLFNCSKARSEEGQKPLKCEKSLETWIILHLSLTLSAALLCSFCSCPFEISCSLF